MKLPSILFFLVLSGFAKSQDNKHSISLNYSNNGNLRNELQEFYFNPIGEYAPGNDVSSYKEISIKFSLNYNFEIKENWGIGLFAGYGARKDKFDISNQPETWTGDQSQKYYSFGVNGLYFWKINKLEIGTGLEVPFNVISDHIQNIYQDEPTQKMHYAQKTTGGFSFGINCLTTVKIFITDFLYLNARASFGFTKLNVGGKTSQYIVSQDPVNYPDTPYSYDNKFSKSYFANPELSFGVGFNF